MDRYRNSLSDNFVVKQFLALKKMIRKEQSLVVLERRGKDGEGRMERKEGAWERGGLLETVPCKVRKANIFLWQR